MTTYPRPCTPAHSARRGFTLIEILVTMTIFAIVLSSLTVALRSALGTWRTVREHQTRQAELDHAFDQLTQDFDALTILSKETPALRETATEAAGDDLTLTVLGRLPLLAAEPGFEWATVRYSIQTVQGSADKALMREVKPMIAASPMIGGESRIAIIQGARSVRFSYLTPQETLPQWQDAGTLPPAVEVRVTFDSGPPFVRVLPVTHARLQAEASS